ncbi:MAG TPA: ROK family protein [Rhizomicrobium sp.]
MSNHKAIAGIELGGTKLLCRVVDGSRVLANARFATSTPEQALADICGCLGDAPLAAIGIASFGAVSVNPASPDYGRILKTPKPGWSGFDLRGALLKRYGVPVAVDSDVNAAALAERRLGAGQGHGSVAYVTIGTGIGGGLATPQGVLHGALHPEIGHIRLARRARDDFRGACPFHGDCAEGLVSGTAIRARMGGDGAMPPETFALVADYLGELAATLVLAWSPQKMIMGGGVMNTPGLLAAAAQAMRASLGGYGPELTPDYLASPRFADSGLEGALLMAQEQRDGDAA